MSNLYRWAKIYCCPIVFSAIDNAEVMNWLQVETCGTYNMYNVTFQSYAGVKYLYTVYMIFFVETQKFCKQMCTGNRIQFYMIHTVRSTTATFRRHVNLFIWTSHYTYIYTVETLYDTINFCWSTHERHSIARPKGRGMGCLLWVQRATYCVDLSILSSIKYLL